MRQLIAGNWKMNGLRESLGELRTIAQSDAIDGIEALICPPATLIAEAASVGGVAIGGQDCHANEAGAHTGDVSANMLRDAGASHVIVGHSERRTDHGETNEMVRAKAEAAQGEGLVAIVCVGETETEREEGRTAAILAEQVSGSVPTGSNADTLVVAYEPVWAIGTGKVAEANDIVEAHRTIRDELQKVIGDGADTVRILYGGSVKPGNAGDILPLDGVDGALVGGASLKASDFLAICEAAPR